MLPETGENLTNVGPDPILRAANKANAARQKWCAITCRVMDASH